MKRILLVLAIPLLMGASCSILGGNKEEDVPVVNQELKQEINNKPTVITKVENYDVKKITNNEVESLKFIPVDENFSDLERIHASFYKRENNFYFFSGHQLFLVSDINVSTIEFIKERNWPTLGNFLLKDEFNIYDFDSNEQKLRVLSQLDANSFEAVPTDCLESEKYSTSCASNFFLDKNGVYNINIEPITSIENLDPDTTKLLELAFPTEYVDQSDRVTIIHDQDTVYRTSSGQQVIILYPSLDFESLAVLSNEYQSDKNSVFYSDRTLVDYKQNIVEAIVIKDADSGTFEVLDWCGRGMGGTEYFAKDINNMYALGKKFPASLEKFKKLGVMASGIESSQIYSTDGENIYVGCSGTILPNLDSDTFEIVEGLYVKDKDIVYDHTGRFMEGVNPDDCTKDTLEKCNPDGIIPF